MKRVCKLPRDICWYLNLLECHFLACNFANCCSNLFHCGVIPTTEDALVLVVVTIFENVCYYWSTVLYIINRETSIAGHWVGQHIASIFLLLWCKDREVHKIRGIETRVKICGVEMRITHTSVLFDAILSRVVSSW